MSANLRFEFAGIAGNEKLHTEVYQPLGGGESFKVMVNKYYEGSLHLVRGVWQVYLNPRALTQLEDVQLFIETIEAAGYRGI